MKTIRLLMTTLFVLGTHSPLWAIEGFSGSFWGIAIYESLEQNPITLGSVRQGVDWLKFYDLKFSTYAQFRYRFEQEEAEFFDAYGPSLGVSITGFGLRLGWEYEWERYLKQDETKNKSRTFLEWYYSWDLKKLIKQ